MPAPLPEPLALLLLIAPAALGLVAALGHRDPGARSGLVSAAASVATLAALGLAAVAAVVVAVHGPLSSPVLGAGDLGLSVRLDPLSAVMFSLVAFLGVVIVQFSRSYLDGDPHRGAFLGSMCLALAAVLLLVLSGNLLQLVAAWMATSLTVQRLLLFYGDRPRARAAARKKRLVARLGDACLIMAAVLLGHSFATADIGVILAEARSQSGSGELAVSVPVAAVLLALAALLKSAQFPSHGWLPEVAEAPTPVSALLHAGVINAGGFLVLRFADVMLLGTSSLHILVIVGGFTALFASMVMLTQTSVKASLAYSTVAQMGFMMFECGLGAFSLAALHIVAHSLYKAHAFLGSGGAVELVRTPSPPAERRGDWLRVFAGLGSALALFAVISTLLDVSVRGQPASVALGAILVMGLTHLMAKSLAGRLSARVVGRTVLAAAATTVVYLVLERAAAGILSPTLPPTPEPEAVMFYIMVAASGAFALLTVLQLMGPRAGSAAWRAAYVHLGNGLYLNVLLDRVSGALGRSLRSIPETTR